MIIARPNNIIIKPFFDPDVSAGGIIIPESSRERADQGIVKYVGDDTRFAKIGDIVLFSGYSGTLIRLAGEGLMITMHERLIVAVIGSTNWNVTPVKGLYYKDSAGNYFEATYESTVDRLYETRLEFHGRVRFGGWKVRDNKIEHRPTIEEIQADTRWTETKKEIRENI